ncbi:MAG: sigma-70 family RNA polymerase sigma factor [Planctomycetota bacterium]|nr:sigma-70 family RNA polymerase sigma factor [Planctomycetota bacterium]
MRHSVETPSALGTSEALRRLAQGRDAEAWAALLARHGAEIHRVARRILRDEGLAEDASQETLLVLRDYAGRFQPSGKEPDEVARGWVLRIACSTALQMSRSRKRAKARDARGAGARPEPPADGPSEHAEEREAREAALDELARLPEDQRMPLVLHYFGGLEYERIGAQLGCTPGAARVRAHRGLENLRRRLALLALIFSLGQLEKLLGGAAEAAEASWEPSASQQQQWRDLLDSARKPVEPPPLTTGGWTMFQKLSLVSMFCVAALLALAATRSDGATPSAAPRPSPPPRETAGEEKALPPLPDLSDADKLALARAGNAFALDLFGKLRARDGNLFFSPYSVNTALGMLYPGARARTAAQIKQTLHAPFEGARFAEACAALLKAQNTAEGGQAPHTLRIANRLWGQQGEPFVPAYLRLTKEYFGAGLEAVDFAAKPEEARRTINAWVAERTEQKIPELLADGAVSEATRLVLTNAIYFKGSWVEPFDPALTRPAAFEPAPGRKLAVPTMHHGEFKYEWLKNETVQVLRLAYRGNGTAAYFVLPAKRHALAEVEQGLKLETLNGWLEGVKPNDIMLAIPKFRIRSRFDMTDALRGMGMSDAFTPGADFSGITGNEMFVNRVVHEAYVDLDEKGTEAAAATAVGMDKGEPPSFTLDQPFLFLIRDEKSKAILFMGRIADPR